MKCIFLLLALSLLAGCAVRPAVDASEPVTPTLKPYQESEESTPEERNAWLEEQTALAEEFLNEHRDLLDEIATVILETEIAEQYLEFYISPEYTDDSTPCLVHFWRTSEESGHYQGYNAAGPELTLAGLSEELDLLATELCVLRPMGISYSNTEYVHSLQIGFAAASFSGGKYLCDVSLDCQMDGAHDWAVISDYHYMDGL